MPIILQLIIKQWDKGQRSPEAVAERASRPVAFPLKPTSCAGNPNPDLIIEFHGDDRLGDRHTARHNTTTIEIDKFTIDRSTKTLTYDEKTYPLNDNYHRFQYTHRYGITHAGKHYWLYEEVTLNATSINSPQPPQDIFTTNPPDTIIDTRGE